MALTRSHRSPLLAGLAVICLSLAGGEPTRPVTLKVVALGERGTVGDLNVQDWQVKVGGLEAKVLSQRPPAETEKEGQKWAFVLLPIREPEYRKTALLALATFMSKLPPSDSVLVALRTSKGLECLTPGFTVRPSLWAKALDNARVNLGARLPGNAGSVLGFVPASDKEAGEDSMAPVSDFLARLSAETFQRRVDDFSSLRRSITDAYPVEDLAGYTQEVATTLKSLETLGEAISHESGQKHVILFSRNEIDDLANPAWNKMNAKVSALSSNNLNRRLAAAGQVDENIASVSLKTQTMIRDMTLALDAFSVAVGRLGLEVHSVGPSGSGYSGAFSEVAAASGGNTYPINRELALRLPFLLGCWSGFYEIKVAVPDGVAQPAKVVVKTPRKDVRLFTPRTSAM